MEATVAPLAARGREGSRIISAMRASVSTRGAGPVFDLYHVAREAGVSRGLLHYYFGSKERLLVEVVRHDCEVRIETMESVSRVTDSLDEIVQAPPSASRVHRRRARQPGGDLRDAERVTPREEIASSSPSCIAAGAPRRGACAEAAGRTWSSCGRTPRSWPPCCSPSATVWASRSPTDPRMGSPLAFELGMPHRPSPAGRRRSTPSSRPGGRADRRRQSLGYAAFESLSRPHSKRGEPAR